MMPEGLGTVASALLALGLVAVAVALSLYERLDLEKDIAVAVVRSFAQLTAIGFVINRVFGLDNVGYVALLLAGMVLFAGWTSSRRAEGVPRVLPIATLAIAVAAAATLGMLLLLQIVPLTARYLIPLGGMVIGNSMYTASLVLLRIRDDVGAQLLLRFGADLRVAHALRRLFRHLSLSLLNLVTVYAATTPLRVAQTLGQEPRPMREEPEQLPGASGPGSPATRPSVAASDSAGAGILNSRPNPDNPRPQRRASRPALLPQLPGRQLHRDAPPLPPITVAVVVGHGPD